MTLVDPAIEPARRPEPERDRWGRYKIPHPTTGKPQSWTRATTFASSVADTFGLTKWQLRMTALGLAQRADLLAAVASTHDDNSKELDRLCEAAKEHAGAGSRARLGTALHAFAERVDAGETVNIPAPWDADIAAYRQAMDQAGIVMDRSHIERIVTVPEYEVAGTFDRLATYDGRLMVADLKTGRDLNYSWTEISIQLALYAHAATIWDAANGAHLLMPEVDLERALVMHLPVGEAKCTLYLVDIAAGWETARLCADVRLWRKRKGLAEQVGPELAMPTLTAVPDPDLITKTEWLRGRIIGLGDVALPVHLPWPEVPTFPAMRESGQTHTADQLATIETWVDAVESALRAPFPDPDPSEPKNRPVANDDPRVLELQYRAAPLYPDLLQRVQVAMTEAKVPSLRNGVLNETHLDVVSHALSSVETENSVRRESIEGSLAVAAEHGATVELLTASVGVKTLDDLDADGANIVGTIADALAHPDRALAVVDGRLEVAKPAVIEGKFGGKGGLLKTAKEVAPYVRRPKPRNSGDVLADPVLVAALICE